MPLLQAARRPVGVVAISVALFALLAPPPVSAQDEEPQALVIEDVGVGLRGVRYQAPDAPLPRALPAVIAFVVQNPNDGFAAEGVRLRLSIYGANSQRIDLGYNILLLPIGPRELIDVPQILPRERRALVMEVSIGQDELPLSHMEAEVVSVARWIAVREVPLLEVHGVMADPSTHSDLRPGWIAIPVASGTLTNPLDAALGEVLISGIVYDGAGRIVGGSVRRLPYVPPSAMLRVSTAVLIYGTDIHTRTLVGASWGRAEVFAAYPWIDLTLYRR